MIHRSFCFALVAAVSPVSMVFVFAAPYVIEIEVVSLHIPYKTSFLEEDRIIFKIIFSLVLHVPVN